MSDKRIVKEFERQKIFLLFGTSFLNVVCMMPTVILEIIAVVRFIMPDFKFVKFRGIFGWFWS